MSFTAPDIDYAGLSPVIALTVGLCVVLLAGLVGERRSGSSSRRSALVTLGAAAGLCIWQWGERKDLVAGALRLDDLGLAGVADRDRRRGVRRAAVVARAGRRARPGASPATASSRRSCSPRCSAWSCSRRRRTWSRFFVALELLSIPLYVLCGSALRRRESLESGLKYLIVGSLGSATLLYGMAFIYGGSGSTDFTGIREGIGAGSSTTRWS